MRAVAAPMLANAPSETSLSHPCPLPPAASLARCTQQRHLQTPSAWSSLAPRAASSCQRTRTRVRLGVEWQAQGGRIHRGGALDSRMCPDEEKMTKRSPLDFPIEWERPAPGRRPDIFPQFSPMKTPLPPPPPSDPPYEEEDEEEKKEEEPDPEEEPEQQPDEQPAS